MFHKLEYLVPTNLRGTDLATPSPPRLQNRYFISESKSFIRSVGLFVLCSVTRLLEYFHYLAQIWTHNFFCQSRFNTFPNTKLALKSLPNTFERLSKWRNFAKSGHTGSLAVEVSAFNLKRESATRR